MPNRTAQPPVVPRIDRSGCLGTRHGTYVAYNKYGCRCPDARNDWRLYVKRRRQGRAPVRRIDATGTIRRIQALWALGHNSTTIAAHAPGLTRDHVLNLARGRRWVSPKTYDSVRAAYDALSMTTGQSWMTRRHANRAGYLPPLAWDDDTLDDPTAEPYGAGSEDPEFDHAAVERALAGEPVRLSHADRVEATSRLLDLGVSPTRISKRLRISGTTMNRVLADVQHDAEGAA